MEKLLSNEKAEIQILSEIRSIIENTRNQVAVTVNSAMTMLYWHIGDCINREVLGCQRAEYGKRIIENISKHLTEEYGKGFDQKSLRRMIQFANLFPDAQIVATLSRHLSWSHFLLVIPIDDALQRNFYLTMASDQNWSVRTLKAKINGMLYERTAIAKQPEQVILQDLENLRNERKMSADLAFQDPYFLDFLGLNDMYSEKDLESAIVAEMQNFIIELGNDFAFMARQKRIAVDGEDYYIDLLFYHRRLKCLVAIDLKLGKFKAEYKGQMELYLRWLERYEMVEGENKPIGLILCAGKNEEHVELLRLKESNIRVADYMTTLPDSKILSTKLVQAIQRAKQRLLEL